MLPVRTVVAFRQTRSDFLVEFLLNDGSWHLGHTLDFGRYSTCLPTELNRWIGLLCSVVG